MLSDLRSTTSVGSNDRHAERDRAKSADLVLGRNRARVPWMRFTSIHVIDQRESLTFRILEVERQPAVVFSDLAGRNTRARGTAPPSNRTPQPRHAQMRS